jgi:hypothetical protein
MIFDADVFVPATDELQFAIRSTGDSYSPVFTTASELLGVSYASTCPEVIYDGFVHVTKVDQAIAQIFEQANSGNNVLFRVVDEAGSLVGWQVSVCYNADDYDDEDDYDEDWV